MSERVITPEQASHLREQCKHRIAIRDALHRLEANPDFQLLVKDYTEDEAVRLVNLLGEATFNLAPNKSIHRDELHECMVGIARFNAYMRNIYRLADQAIKSLDDLNKAESTFDNEAIDVENN